MQPPSRPDGDARWSGRPYGTHHPVSHAATGRVADSATDHSSESNAQYHRPDDTPPAGDNVCESETRTCLLPDRTQSGNVSEIRGVSDCKGSLQQQVAMDQRGTRGC
eukprot:2285877-Prymnesium_polylepis.1